MSVTAQASFEITRWDATPYDEDAGGPALNQVAVGKTFTGDLVGTSSARLLTSTKEGREGAGYVASERVVGRLGGKAPSSSSTVGSPAVAASLARLVRSCRTPGPVTWPG